MRYKEKTNEEKYLEQYDNMEISLSKAMTEEDRKIIATNWAKTEAGFTDDTISNALEQRDEMNERESNMSGGMIKYNMGGSMLNPPERQKYSGAGKVVRLIAEALDKTTKAGKKPSRAKVRQAVDDVKKENPNLTKEIAGDIQEVKDLRYAENYGVGGGGKRDIDSMFTSLLRGNTESIDMTSVPLKATKTYKAGQMKGAGAGFTAGIIASFGGKAAYDKLTEKKKSAFDSAFSEAHNAGESSFSFGGKDYTTEVKKGKSMGGQMYAEGGSMLMPPEMEMESDIPEDTYPNIPEDEMAEAEASQLPDAEMEEDYTGYVLEQSLDMEEQEYLMGVLETDERLSGIFDKVMDVAGEFSGEGEVSGLGTGVSDSIPARLSDGEFVFTKKATDQMGADQLQTMMDDAEKAYDGGLKKMAFGGINMGDAPEIEEEEEAKLVRARMVNADRMPSTNKG